MPHLTLEYSDNVIEQEELASLFQNCHDILEKTLPTNKANCKSRAIKQTSFFMGDGNPQNAFVHVNLKIMPGRTAETLNQLGQKIMALLNAYFAESKEKRVLQISLEIIELQDTYFKN